MELTKVSKPAIADVIHLRGHFEMILKDLSGKVLEQRSIDVGFCAGYPERGSGAVSDVLTDHAAGNDTNAAGNRS